MVIIVYITITALRMQATIFHVRPLLIDAGEQVLYLKFDQSIKIVYVEPNDMQQGG